MILGIQLGVEPVRSRDFSTVDFLYMSVGSRLTQTTRILHVQNLMNVKAYFSFDGIHDHFILPAAGFIQFDIVFNRAHCKEFALALGERIYVKLVDDIPTKGAVYITSFYGKK